MSLRGKVMSLLLVLSLAPLVIAGVVNVHRAVERGKRTEQLRYTQAAQAAAQAFGTLAGQSLVEARVLARRYPLNRKGLNALVRQGGPQPVDLPGWDATSLVHELNDAEITTVLAASDGRVLGTAPHRHVGTISLADLLANVPPTGGLVTGRVPPLTDGRWPGMAAIHPIRHDGGTIGWVALITHGARLAERVQMAASELEGRVGLFDRQGRSVVLSGKAHTQGPTRQQWVESDAPSGAREVQADGTTWLVAWAKVPKSSLSVQTRVEAARAYRHIYVLIWILTGVIVLTFLLVMFFADYLASVLLRPIHALERGAEMIGSGALHHRIEVDGHQHDELGRLANAFNQMADGLEASQRQVRAYSRSLETANTELDALVHGISHDLKKSLRTVEAFATFLEEDYSSALGEDGAGLVHGVLTNIQRVERFTDDIVRLVQQERTRGEAVRFELSGLLEEVHGRIKLQHPAGTLIFASNLPELHADRAQIGMLFENLIANGLKFNLSPQPQVEVRVEDDLLDWRLLVEDNGIGIDSAERESVFELFRRLHRHSDYPGTGTGLTLARRVVEDHRGTITIEDAPNGGTQVVVTLPKRPQLLTLPGVRPPG